MIFQILFFIIFGVIGVVGSYLPGYGQVPLLLPWGLDLIFSQVSSYVHGAILTFPYLSVVLQALLYGLLFELALMFIKLFLGSRAPTN